MKSEMESATMVDPMAAATPSSNTAAENTDNYPQRPITLVIGGPPGDGTDMLARRFSERLSALLGQRVGIEYRLGASGNLAAMAVAHAAPDGYTILIGTRSSTLHKAMYPHLNYDFEWGLTPVAMVARMPIGILMGNHVVANNIREIIEMSKRKTGQTSVAILGVGTTSHLAAVVFEEIAGIRFRHVPYLELSNALTDVARGTVDLLIAQLSGAMSHIKAGTLRALAVTSATRVLSLPDVPTIAEEGFPEVSADEWFATLVPSGTPPSLVAKLNAAVNQVLADEDLRRDLVKMGYLLPSAGNTSAAFEKFVAGDRRRWTRVLQEHHVDGFQ